jgi:primosomal protein N' (replication factor Y) (superfamily II helicase)
VNSVAQVRVDVPVPHLDRVFDYAIPASLADDVRPGVRVRVRFAGRLVNGFVVGIQPDSEHNVRPIERVLGVDAVLTPQISELAQRVAEHYAGSVHDVLRFAVPPRHARAEQALQAEQSPATWQTQPPDRWSRYQHGERLCERLAAGEPVRAVWSLAPASDWVDDVEALIRIQSEGSVLVVAPDATDVQRLQARMADADPAILLADHGPERRYRAFLRILRGHTRLVIGTRSAIFAPIRDLRLIIVWGDGDDALWDQHAPYWNARDVAAIRTHQQGCALIIGSPARTTEAQTWCDNGWAVSIAASRDTIQRDGPRVRGDEGDDAGARIPRAAWQVIQKGLESGPVLVQVARRGYLPRLACQKCRVPIECGCGGPLQLTSGHAIPTCAWCGRLAGDARCPTCGGSEVRALAIGAERTAEEFGRAFPSAAIIWSAGDQIRRTIDDVPAIVVATQGAEPIAPTQYAAVVLADARSVLYRGSLRAAEEAVYRWFSAVSLARPRAPVIVTADPGLAPVQSLVRWSAPWFAQREIVDRAATHMPPASRMVVLRGDADDVREVIGELPQTTQILGPVDGRAIVLIPRDHAADVIAQLHAITIRRSAERGSGVVTVIVDPREP